MKTLILKILSLLFLGCLTVRKDFSPNTIRPGEGVIVGRINIIYNGMPRTGNCGVRLDGEKEIFVYFTQEGWFLANVPAGITKFAKMTCSVGGGSAFFYDFKNVLLRIKPYPAKTYVGDLMINWETEGGTKASDHFGVIGAIADGVSSDGIIQVAVRNNASLTEADYRRKFPEDTVGEFSESVLSFAELNLKK